MQTHSLKAELWLPDAVKEGHGGVGYKGHKGD